MLEHLVVTRDGDTLRITMNRPQRRNSLSGEHLAELLDAIGSAGDATGIVVARKDRCSPPATTSPTWRPATCSVCGRCWSCARR